MKRTLVCGQVRQLPLESGWRLLLTQTVIGEEKVIEAADVFLPVNCDSSHLGDAALR